MNITVEDYLKAIYEIEEKHGVVTTSDLAEQVGVAPASATTMLKKLGRMTLVDYTPYQGVTLTAAGRRVALRVVRHHRLAELFLFETLGVPWDRVHAEAHKWEHALSEDVATRIEAFLNHPLYDPHGDPIPSATGEVPQRDLTPLTTLAVGETALIARVDTREAEILQYLGDLGLYPQTALSLVSKAPFDGPLTVRVNEQQHILGHAVAEKILILVNNE